MSDSDLETIKAGMAGVYERNAAAWDEGRDTSLREKDWLTRWLDGLPVPSKILDLGCGAGRPLSGYLVELGHEVVGVDAGAAMIARAQANVPAATFQIADMRTLDLGESFDAILSWDAFFHLSPEEQRAALPMILKHLKPGGHLLMTVGDDEGEVTGTVAGEPVSRGIPGHASIHRLCRDHLHPQRSHCTGPLRSFGPRQRHNMIQTDQSPAFSFPKYPGVNCALVRKRGWPLPDARLS